MNPLRPQIGNVLRIVQTRSTSIYAGSGLSDCEAFEAAGLNYDPQTLLAPATMRCWGARTSSGSNSQTSSALQVEVAKQAKDEEGSRRKHMALPLCGPQQPISAVDLTAWVRGAIGCAWEDRYAAACMQLHSECGCDNTAALQLLERDDLTSVGFKPFHAKQICARLAHRLEAGAVPEASVKQADTEFEDCISDGPSGAALSVPKERGTRR